MVNGNSNIILCYLNSYFKENTKPLTIFDVDMNNLSLKEISEAFDDLAKKGIIKLNNKYIYPCVEGLNKSSSK